jgi:hypothetical protein
VGFRGLEEDVVAAAAAVVDVDDSGCLRGLPAFFFGGRPRRFLGGCAMTVSAGNNPISTDMVKAFGIESQVLPLGAIHLRRLRFCHIINSK